MLSLFFLLSLIDGIQSNDHFDVFKLFLLFFWLGWDGCIEEIDIIATKIMSVR